MNSYDIILEYHRQESGCATLLVVSDAYYKSALRVCGAADEMLAALETLVALDDGDTIALWPHTEKFARARAALANAKGEQS